MANRLPDACETAMFNDARFNPLAIAFVNRDGLGIRYHFATRPTLPF